MECIWLYDQPVSVINPVKMNSERGRPRPTAASAARLRGYRGNSAAIHSGDQQLAPLLSKRPSGQAGRRCERYPCPFVAAAAQYLKTKYYESKFAPQWSPKGNADGEGRKERGSTMPPDADGHRGLHKAVQKFHDNKRTLDRPGDG